LKTGFGKTCAREAKKLETIKKRKKCKKSGA